MPPKPDPGHFKSDVEWVLWVCPTCGYFRCERATGVHMAEDSDDPNGKMVAHDLVPVEVVPK